MHGSICRTTTSKYTTTIFGFLAITPGYLGSPSVFQSWSEISTGRMPFLSFSTEGIMRKQITTLHCKYSAYKEHKHPKTGSSEKNAKKQEQM